ncbi:class I SAM-dependent methyltransferase [Brevibacterium daeguense]|uniref:Class I SAM-dependent methyltransferase n=1 Tax=Brevibacterium daeguense TaxID=909936 RepID=A0ABP8EPD9_9MICO|nr:class I SAM-dependent methyltransferase [Brevibacterium daeguense]
MTGPRIHPDSRRHHGRRFGDTAELYDAVRPGYPAAVVDAIVADLPGRQVCDLGAGTGKLSSALLERGLDVVAVDPDPASLSRNPASSVLGSGERIPLGDASQHAIFVAQAWHWMDPADASAEIVRVLRPGGRLWILINQLDVRVDWVLRLSRIMHAGDVYRPEWRPMLPSAFTPVEAGERAFSAAVTVEDIVGLAATRSYWLRSPDRIRQRVEANIRWYFEHEHPVAEGAVIDLPYLCLHYRAVRLSEAQRL